MGRPIEPVYEDHCRQEQAPTPTISVHDLLPPMQNLDQLDAATSISSTLRRFHLTRLLDHRISLENGHKNARPNMRKCRYAPEGLNGLLGKGETSNGDTKSVRADTKALADLMAESYPRLKRPTRDEHASTDTDYQDKLKKLQNRLSCARNWYALQQRFSPGILALVPCGGEFHIQIDQ
jgi:hypothetical protein